MKKRVLVAGLLACMVVPPQASAQVEGIFGIIDQVIREGARQQQIQQERERRQQEIYRQHEAQLALNRRAQTALKELGFYTMAIDGQVGPGTRRAIAEYIRAFEMPDRPLNENDITILERRAQAGFRSLAETRDAQSRGFTTRRDWRAAVAAGFTNAREWQQARRVGIDDQASWRRFRDSGFDSVAQYDEARARGFETRRALERAERAGFDTQEDYAAFVESGAPDRATFERRRVQLEIAGEAREACLEAVSEEDWARAAPHCSQAATVLRNDDALLAARATAARRLDVMIAATSADRGRLQRRLNEAKDALALVETDLANLDQGSTEDERGVAQTERAALREQLEDLAQELADADTMLARAERGRHRATCFTESAAERWTAAVAACTVARNADPDDRESAKLLAVAEAEREAERLRAEEERRAVALADAHRKGAAMIEAIDAFIDSGGRFDEGLAVSRAVVSLKAALEEQPSRSESTMAKDSFVEPEPMLQAQAALADLLASERSYQAFHQARSDAERAAQASALTQAEENVRRLEAFIRDHLARNVLSPDAGELLTLQEALEEVLDSDDADRIVRQQSDAMAALESLGLGADARAFSLTPRIAASDNDSRGIGHNPPRLMSPPGFADPQPFAGSLPPTEKNNEIKISGDPAKETSVGDKFGYNSKRDNIQKMSDQQTRLQSLQREERRSTKASMPAAGLFSPLPRPDALAVVIGNRNYQEAPEVRFAHNDATAFATYFTDVMGLEAHKVLLEEDLTSVGMSRLFGRPGGPDGRVHNLARFVDEVFVFYSGHGVPEIRLGEAARGYLLPVDVPPETPGFGAYPLDDLIAQLQSLPVSRVTLFIDACFSGLSESGSLVPDVSGAFGVSVAPPPRKANVSVMAATAFDQPQLARWLPDREHGAFTYLALDGLHGAADRDGDRRVTLTELQRFIDERLAFKGFDQSPSLLSAGDDVLIMDFSEAQELPVFER